MLQTFLIDKNIRLTMLGKVWGVYLSNEDDDRGKEIYLDFANNRIKYYIDDHNNIKYFITKLFDMAELNQIEKIWGMCKSTDKKNFENEGFICEGYIPGFFEGETGYCMSYFLKPYRKENKNRTAIQKILDDVEKINVVQDRPKLHEGYLIALAEMSDAPALADLYSQVFASYPTPLMQQGYIEYLIKNNKSIFAKILYEKKLVSAASADVNWELSNAEMTDCATLPEHTRKGLMRYAIYYLENEMRKKDINTFYSISRAMSPGINIIFKKLGYIYTGTLINNCHICGQFEDMNLWVK